MKKFTQRIVSATLAIMMLMTTTMPVLANSGALTDPSTTVTINDVQDNSQTPTPEPTLEPVGDGNSLPQTTVPTPTPEPTPESTPAPDDSSSSAAPDANSDSNSSSSDAGDATDDNSDSDSSNSDTSEDADSNSNSQSELPEEETDGLDEQPEDNVFEELEILESTQGLIEPNFGDEVTLSVSINRDDVNVRYQWQKINVLPEEPTENTEEVSEEGTDEYLSESGYFFPVIDMTETELLAFNPDADWTGKSLWEEAVEIAGGDASRVEIPNGTKTLAGVLIDGVALNVDENGEIVEEISDEQEIIPVWEDILDATTSTYTFTVTEETTSANYRCIVYIEDPEYEISAAAYAKSLTEEFIEADNSIVDQSGESKIVDGVIVRVQLMSSEAIVSILDKAEEAQTFSLNTLTRMANGSYGQPSIRLNNGWLEGVDYSMEYITEKAYNANGGNSANNPYWTKLSGGTRADGTTYTSYSLDLADAGGGTSNVNRMPTLSAWYGETIYVRYVGDSGKGSELIIPAFTSEDFRTGEKYLYKNAVNVLSVRVPETPQPQYLSGAMGFYSGYIDAIINNDWELLGNANGAAIMYTNAPLTPGANTQYCFNTNPERYLLDAEGNYRFDSVMIGVAVYAEPDLSGKAAWALHDYIHQGYGFMTGHDMLYAYGGIYDEDWSHGGSELYPAKAAGAEYIPDPNSTATPYFVYGALIAGGEDPSYIQAHYNMNWLVGQNKYYTETSPYSAASMILNIGNEHDKTPMYGYDYGLDGGFSEIRISKTVAGNPISDPSIRVPTNYPYASSESGISWNDRPVVRANTTHSNMQMAYGNIWIDFYGQNLTDIGVGRLVTDTREGLNGTNNFYLTTHGNIAMNQIGHWVEGNVYFNELYLFANSVMYISQRQQDQIDQSQQGGNMDVHFVHKIASVEELEKIGDPNFWYTYPMDGAYMLTESIQLPDDWQPIEGFYGHFNADGHVIELGANGAPLFRNTVDEGETGWNLGLKPENGGTDYKYVDRVYDEATGETRTTGIARVSGYLATLFGTSMQKDWSNYVVQVVDDQGRTYTGLTNVDGKYVISNVPPIGIMDAFVYEFDGYNADGTLKTTGREVTEYGIIQVDVPERFWDTSETIPLYLIGFNAIPVKDIAVYEGENAIMAEGGIRWNEALNNSHITWQYRSSGTANWTNLSGSGITYVQHDPVFDAEKGITTTEITINKADTDWTGYQFRAVFNYGGRTSNTHDESRPGYQGQLTVIPLPMKVTDPASQTITIDGTATFTSSVEAAVDTNTGLSVRWQIRGSEYEAWTFIDEHPLVSGATSFSVDNVVSTGTWTAHPDVGREPTVPATKTTSTLSIIQAPVGLTGYQVRAVYSYSSAIGGHPRTAYSSDNAATLTVTPPDLRVEWAADMDTRDGITYENALQANLSTGIANSSIVYEADVYYTPGADETTHGTPDIDVVWTYQNQFNQTLFATPVTTASINKHVTDLRITTRDSSITVPTIVQNQTDPVKQADGTYKVTTTLTISNIHWRLYGDDSFLMFSPMAVAKYATLPYTNYSAETDYRPMYVDFPVGIKWNVGEKDTKTNHSVWTYPDMEVNSLSGVKTLMLTFDAGLNSGRTVDARDTFIFGDGTSDPNNAPPGMTYVSTNPQYAMFVSNTEDPVDSQVVENWLRTELSVVSYDVTSAPKVLAYIHADTRLQTPSGSVPVQTFDVSFDAGANGTITGQSSFNNLYYNDTVMVPTLTPDAGYELTHWQDQYGVGYPNTLTSLDVKQDVTLTAYYKTAGDDNLNGVPDEAEVRVTFKTTIGAFDGAVQETSVEAFLLSDLTVSDSYSATGSAIVEYVKFPSVTIPEGYGNVVWEDESGTVITGDVTITGNTTLTATLSSLEDTDMNGNGTADNEEKIVYVRFVADGATGYLSGQREFVGVEGMTWDEVGVQVPIPVATSPITFKGWDKDVTDMTTVLTADPTLDFTVELYTGTFEGPTNPSPAPAPPSGASTFSIGNAETFAANTISLMSSAPVYQSVGASPRAALRVQWAGSPNPGSPLTAIVAGGSANFYQWQVNTDGAWQDIPFSNQAAYMIPTATDDMDGWKFRVRYGTSEATANSYTNEITVQYRFSFTFSGLHLQAGPGVGMRGTLHSGHWTIPASHAEYRSRVTMVSYSGYLQAHHATTGHAPDGNLFGGGIINGVTQGGTAPGGAGQHSFSGSSAVWSAPTVQSVIYNGASAVAYPQSYSVIHTITISGGGGSANGSTSVFPFQRSAKEAWDVTSVTHGFESKEANVVAKITAYDKVYDGTETIATVELVDLGGLLTRAQLDAMEARGTISYTPGSITGGSATSGSNAINAGTYSATFTPNASDMYAFAGNGPTEVAQRSTTFIIHQRPVYLESFNNDRPYDKTDLIDIKNITFTAYDAANKTGVIPSDINRVALSTTTAKGNFNGVIDQTDGAQIQITRLSSSYIGLAGVAAGNYKIAGENYTGAITPRQLHVHSLYQEPVDDGKNPRNVKQYDDTTDAIIKDIVIDNIVPGDTVWVDKDEYEGTYATSDAGETLNADGTTQEDRYLKLAENDITRTENMTLVNNDKGNYEISTEDYSGAIFRRSIDFFVGSESITYGEDYTGTWETSDVYSKNNTGVQEQVDLIISSLYGDDEITIDDTLSRFVFERTIDNKTPVGTYIVKYEGLSEANYPVLSNYIPIVSDGTMSVTPRILTATVAGGYEKEYGAPMPEMAVTFDGLANNGDTIADAVTGVLQFNTQCTQTSDVRYMSDGVTYAPYSVTGYGLESRLNENGQANYLIEWVHGDITVIPTPITIQAIDKVKTYGNGDPEFDYTLSKHRVNPSDLQFDLDRIAGEDVGVYDIIFDETELSARDKGNYDITFIPAELTINPRQLFVSTGNYQKLYGDPNPSFTVRYAGFVMGDTKETATNQSVVIECQADEKSIVGDYTISVSGETIKENTNGLYNYEIVHVSGNLKVLPRPITVVAENKVKYFGEGDPEFTWKLAGGSIVVDPDNFPFVVNSPLTRDPGETGNQSYPIYFTDAELANIQKDNPNYVVSQIPGALTILKLSDTDLVIKIADATKVYGEAEPTSEYHVEWYADKDGQHILPEGTSITSVANLGLTGTLRYTADGTSPRDVGNYPINGSGLTSSNYEDVTIIPGNLSVTPRPVTITPDDKTKTYGDNDPTFTYSLLDEITGTTYDDGSVDAARVKPTDLQVNLSRTPGEDVGFYDIFVDSITNSSNYTVTNELGELEITPRPLVVTVWNSRTADGIFERGFGVPNPPFEVKYDGFVYGDDANDLGGELVYDTEATITTPSGLYDVAASGLTSDNYSISYVPGKLRIIPGTITIVIDDKVKEYGDEDPEFTWDFLGDPGLVDPSQVTGTLERVPGEDANQSYLITGDFDSGNPDVGVTVIPGRLTITPAPLVVTADDKERVYGDENPTWTSKISGFKLSDDETVLSGDIIYEVKEADGITDVTRTTDVGDYPINISNSSTLSAENYEITYVDGNLKITPRPIDVTPGGPENRDLVIVKSADKSEVEVGETITYTLNVRNTGNVELVNIKVVDSNNGAGSIVATNGQGYTYNGNGEFNIFRIPVGKSIDITYTYTAEAADAGKDVLNVAVATIPSVPANPGDPNDPNNPPTPEIPEKEIPSNEVEVPVIEDPITPPQGDIKITKVADRTIAEVGDIITYTVTITNDSAVDVTDVKMVDKTNAKGEIVVPTGSDYTYNGNGSFDIPVVKAGGSVVITYTYTVQEGEAGTVITNVAIATIPGDPTDPTKPDKEIPSEEVEVPVVAEGVKIVKTADVAFAKVGDIITYTVSVTNIGTTEITNLVVDDVTNAKGEIDAADGAGYTYVGNGKFNIALLDIGQTINIVYTYTVLAGEDGKTITNVATATIPGDPSDPTDPGTKVPSEEVDVEVDSDLLIIADPQIKVYGDADPELTYKLGEPLVKPDDIWGELTRVPGENVGDYTILQGTVTSTNYDINYIPNILKIIPAPLDITANDAERLVGKENPQFSATYSGFKFNDGPADLGGALALDTIATIQSPVGNYPIVPSGHTSDNYDIRYHNGNLRIFDGADVKLTKTADKELIKVGETVTYTITVENTGSRDLVNFKVTDTFTGGVGDISVIDSTDYSYEGNGEFMLPVLNVGQIVEIKYTYTALEGDSLTVLRNVASAVIPGNPDDPEDPDRETETPEVEVVVDDGSLTITKSANKTTAKVGDTITYVLVVTNTGTVDLNNVTVKDTLTGHGSVTATDGVGYTYEGASTFLIPELLAGRTVTISYNYLVAEQDGGKIVHNVAVAKIPAIPADPGDPNDPTKPPRPEIPEREIPSNEVEVPIEMPPVPPAPPTPPVIVTPPNPETGIGFMDTLPVLLSALSLAIAGAVTVLVVKRKKSKQGEDYDDLIELD